MPIKNQPRSLADIRAIDAILNTAIGFAEAATVERVNVDGWRLVPDAAIVRELRASPQYARALADVAATLGVEPPGLVREALADQ